MTLTGFFKKLLFFSCFCLFYQPALRAQSTIHNQKINGYKGIWFALGQRSDYGDKYSGGLATYTAKHIPLAIYAEKVNKTFFVYGGTTGPHDKYLLCMAGVFDHATGRVTRPTIVFDKLGVEDPHDNPSIAMDDKGHIWVFVSGRGRSRMGYKYRSKLPYSVDGFDQVREEEMTYPQPKYVTGKGFLHLFTKYTGTRELYFETSPDGMTWSEDRKLAGMKRPGDKNSGHYQISGQWGEKICFFFNWHPDGNVDLRTNIYYMQTTDFGKTWTTIEGKTLPLPQDKTDSPALVMEYFSKGKNVYIKDVSFDEKGNPVALYLAGPGHEPGPVNGPRQWYVLHWNGTSWENHPITTSDHNYDTGSLFTDGPAWTFIAPTENTPQQWGAGGEVVMWTSTDKGKSWTRVKQITRRSERNHNYVRKVMGGTDPFRYFWADGNPDKMSESLLYFGDSKGNVWQLPYDMVADEQLPVKVK
ncbi:BNR-4 repeat-containing protein [Ravibacter arvi]|uniref:BNR-4 repeat-containing protein n=1 Tax=Ravibacter arvi TaxID=2051041 RepID=A0ABP8LXE4_9BACT